MYKTEVVMFRAYHSNLLPVNISNVCAVTTVNSHHDAGQSQKINIHKLCLCTNVACVTCSEEFVLY